LSWSEPKGATVSLAGERLGVTNFVWQLGSQRKPVLLLIEREGFQPVRRRVDPLVDRDLRVRLERLPQPKPVRAVPAVPVRSAPEARPEVKPKEAPKAPPIYETL
jgi:hypothetical protein